MDLPIDRHREAVNERSMVRLYQGAARVWLALAFLALLLPPADRMGVWLPLHLALAGAVSVAISGAIALFAQVLTAGPPHPTRLHVSQFVLVNIGVAAAVIGFLTAMAWIVAVGGTCFIAAMVVLAAMVRRSRRRGLNRRHVVPLFLYLAAIGCVIAGATIGALLGAQVITNGTLFVGLRRAHMSLNVMGWVSFAIVGTLITLFPTVFKVRMVSWRGRLPARALVAGLVTLAAGLAIDVPAIQLLGTASYLGGAVAVAWMVMRTMLVPRKHGMPVTAVHIMAATAWWLAGIVGLIVATAQGDLDGFRTTFLVAFVGGWALQTLMGTWLYLLPVWRPGPPEARARWVRVIGRGGVAQVLALNVGLLLLAAAPYAPQASRMESIGTLLAVGAGLVILFKAIAYPAFTISAAHSPPPSE